jgi:two-component system chemotaxis sensor kinase CheA
VELDESRELGRLLGQLQETAMRTRTVALASVAGPLRRAARDLARERGKEVAWHLDGEATELDRHVLERLREPLVALVRNAVDHGIESPAERRAAGKPSAGALRITAERDGARVLVSVADDGRGIDAEAVAAAAGRAGVEGSGGIDAVFEPGVSTAAALTGTSGRGVGLDAVREVVHELHGSVELESSPGAGTRVTLAVPLSVAVTPCLVVEAGGRRWAIPLQAARSAHAAGAVARDDAGEPIAVSGLARSWGCRARDPRPVPFSRCTPRPGPTPSGSTRSPASAKSSPRTSGAWSRAAR